MKHRFLEFIAALAILAIPAVASAAKIGISNAWVRALPGNAAGYFTLTNDDEKAIVLRGAQSDACGMIMLHKSSREGGMATMSHVPELKLAPNETVKFEPGSYHLMCMDPAAAMKPGNTVTIILEFADGSRNPVDFKVRNAAGR